MSATTAAPPLGTPIVQPIHHSAAYAFDTLADARAVFAQRAGGYTYARTGNPNVAALEAEIARREGGAGAVAASSGQAAVALALLTLTGPARDAHAVVSSRLYGGSVDLLTDTLADTGLEVSFADPRNPREWEDAVREGTRVFFLESIANPLTELPELEAIAQIAHRHGAAVVVDNTVATPHLYTPGEHGADFVVHSATKYLAGHGGPLGGLLVATGSFDPTNDPARWPWLTEPRHRWGGRSAVETYGAERAVLGVARCKYLNDLGPCLGATTAHEILQGMATLGVRVERQSATAESLAATLAAHPAVERVHHPASATGRQRELLRHGGYRGAGGVFSVDLAGTPAQVEDVVDSLRLIRLAANIGDVRTLVAHPASMTHCRLTPEQFRASGITERTLRFTVGLEDEAELTADLFRALSVIAEPAPGWETAAGRGTAVAAP
ncbi:O-acetylhomoserine aminocarboxypropyltransferase/cysteine synthase [Kocuria rhizophila]|uniref:aminotransferase class V-fold PLP-dependent enzyme n=1 Tax=Kocuria rhizophila TaxID=72000 RepID=UPI002949936B|nr:aminotransferase class V-fold PLP-dependent enzyme [Kocuria rhizophila]MDV5999984.1 O-acetylhomoserine aminocarboxypropyltransferase/cysteine synthase [Kocuria rhizophila]